MSVSADDNTYTNDGADLPSIFDFGASLQSNLTHVIGPIKPKYFWGCGAYCPIVSVHALPQAIQRHFSCRLRPSSLLQRSLSFLQLSLQPTSLIYFRVPCAVRYAWLSCLRLLFSTIFLFPVRMCNTCMQKLVIYTVWYAITSRSYAHLQQTSPTCFSTCLNNKALLHFPYAGLRLVLALF